MPNVHPNRYAVQEMSVKLARLRETIPQLELMALEDWRDVERFEHTKREITDLECEIAWRTNEPQPF